MSKQKQKRESRVQYKNNQEILDAINKRFGGGSIMVGNVVVPVDAVSSGAVSLDIALGCGGIPRGRICEFYGPESTGKTTLALSVIKQVQLAGGAAAFVDAEHALDPVWARRIGVNIDELAVSQPDSGDQALEICEMLAASGQYQVIVVDSVAALIPQVELDGELSDANIGVQARMMSKALRKLSGTASKTKCIVIFINQLREKIGVMFGNPETTPGGRALKFYSSIRLDIRRTQSIKDKDNILGNEVKVKVVKNKVAPPFQEAKIHIYFGKGEDPCGVDSAAGIVELGAECGIIEKSGSWYNYKELRLGLGFAAACQFLRENSDVAKEIYAAISNAKKITNVIASNQGDDDPGFEDDEELQDEAEA